VLIDSGYSTHAPLTLALLASERGLGDAPLALVANTHCHSDHVGGNAALARQYGCPIAVPAAEAPSVERWDGKALLHDYCDHRVERFAVDREIAAGSRHAWGNLEWQALAAPGHDMAALVFYNAEHGILISGDALWENGFGFVMPVEVDPDALPATRATIEMLAGLDIKVVIPGHGEPFTTVVAAIERARSKLDSFACDSLRIARHALKVNLMFTLLERRRLSLAELQTHVATIGLYREFNALFFDLPPAQFAEMLAGELEKSGAAKRVDGCIAAARA
jgi:glyoxylase-like metal-dependent hydrolase (beta-lactamase superfamily II)